ncbi:hypothetical protein [Ancylobacter sp. IITR112]|uniref:DUF7662 domain-containing protein n=1 Tax=Ancylobacter sp. IITR112 TaxID=3138073 RepID=UPI00352ADAB5
MSKYEPLGTYLAGQPGRRVALDFPAIEAVLRFPLPGSAHRYPAWWANEINGRHVQAHAWMDAGWRVDGIDLLKKEVVFARRGC